MSFHYDTTLDDDVSKVRSRIGDTVANNPYLSDEEITAIVAECTDVIDASCECVRRILAKIARDNDRQSLGIGSTRSQVTQHYQELLERLEKLVGRTASPVLTGASQDEVDELEEDTDLRKAQFAVGMDDMDGSDA